MLRQRLTVIGGDDHDRAVECPVLLPASERRPDQVVHVRDPPVVERDDVPPDLFGRPSAVGFRAPAREDDVPEQLVRLQPRERHCLESPPAVPAEASSPSAMVVDPAVLPVPPFRPVWEERSGISGTDARGMRLLVQPSSGLLRRGFEAAELKPEQVKDGERSWYVVLWVEFSAEGVVESGAGLDV